MHLNNKGPRKCAVFALVYILCVTPCSTNHIESSLRSLLTTNDQRASDDEVDELKVDEGQSY